MPVATTETSQKRSLSYRICRAITRKPGTVALTVAVTLVALFGLLKFAIWWSDNQSRLETEAAAAHAQFIEKKAKENREKRQAAILENCTKGFNALDASASALVAAGKADEALKMVQPCQQFSLAPQSLLRIEAITAADKSEKATAAKEAAARQLQATKRAADEEKARLRLAKTQGVNIGMTAQQAMESNWGKPRKINRTTGAGYEHEQWVYGGGYLYFRNGVLTTIQN